MRTKSLGRILCALLCMAMALSLVGTALAFDPGEDGDASAIAIRITPPAGLTQGSAAVEIRITDNAGAGFRSVQVKAGGGSWWDVTTMLEQTNNRWYCVTDITENCTVQVRVTGTDGTIYEKSEYIQCFDPTLDHRDPPASTVVVDQTGTDHTGADQVDPGPTTTPMTPPGGQGTVIDNVSSTTTSPEENRREFFTIATPDENVFYLIVDRERDSENVYFLNAVTESDLMALAEKDGEAPSQSAIPDPVPVCSCREKCAPGEVNVNCPVCALAYKDCTGTVTTTPADPEPEQPKASGGSGMTILVVIAVAVAGGAGYYFKIYKPKRDELADAEDFDALTGGEEEPTVNEDDLPEPVPAPYAEPDEPDYPEGYGDEDDV